MSAGRSGNLEITLNSEGHGAGLPSVKDAVEVLATMRSSPATPRLLPLLLVLLGTTLGAQEPLNTWCPVMTDREIDESAVTVEYQGKTVWLCCKRCRRDFLADPEKYLAELPQFAAPASASGREDAIVPAEAFTDDVRPPARPGFGLATLGRLHPIVVHFPIALLLFAAAWELVDRMRRRTFYGAAIRPLVLFGATSAWVAVGLGWIFAAEVGGDVESTLLQSHRLLGIAAAVMATVASVLGELWHRRQRPVLGWSYFGLLLATAALVGFAGHLGGVLVHGSLF